MKLISFWELFYLGGCGITKLEIRNTRGREQRGGVMLSHRTNRSDRLIGIELSPGVWLVEIRDHRFGLWG